MSNPSKSPVGPSRRQLLAGRAGLATLAGLSAAARGDTPPTPHTPTPGGNPEDTITTKDGVRIYFKDWGPRSAQPVVFHHGWPLSSDDWDAQLLFFVSKGYRVVAHDRRGHGRPSQVADGHDMDHYAADAAAVVEHLGLKDAVRIGHSTGGGEVASYAAGPGKGRVAKVVLVGAVPPIMLKTTANPRGLPIEVFDGYRQAVAANRAQWPCDDRGL